MSTLPILCEMFGSDWKHLRDAGLWDGEQPGDLSEPTAISGQEQGNEDGMERIMQYIVFGINETNQSVSHRLSLMARVTSSVVSPRSSPSSF